MFITGSAAVALNPDKRRRKMRASSPNRSICASWSVRWSGS